LTVFGPKKEEVKKSRRKLQNGELHNIYASSNIVIGIKGKEIRLTRHAVHGKIMNAHRRFVA